MKRFVYIFAFLLLLGASHADAASLRVCMADPLPVDAVTVPFFIDSLLEFPDLLPGSTVNGSVRCSVIPFPASLSRGVDHVATIQGVNVIGEGGPVSAPVTFRAPAVPAKITGVTVQAVSP